MAKAQTSILETKRLTLRPLTMDDLDVLATLYSYPEVRKYFPDRTLTYEETKKELEWIIDVCYGRHGFGLWATIHKETGAFIGRCGLIPWALEGRSEVEVAYLLAKTYWGQGLATEAAQAILGYGFERLPVERLICVIEPENRASAKVATKIGMTYRKEVEDEFGWASLYAIARPGITQD